MNDLDAERGIAWWNSATEETRAFWLAIASSAVPADAWRAYSETTGVRADGGAANGSV